MNSFHVKLANNHLFKLKEHFLDILTSRANLPPGTWHLPTTYLKEPSLYTLPTTAKSLNHIYTTTNKFLKSQGPGPTSKPNQDLIPNNYAQG